MTRSAIDPEFLKYLRHPICIIFGLSVLATWVMCNAATKIHGLNQTLLIIIAGAFVIIMGIGLLRIALRKPAHFLTPKDFKDEQNYMRLLSNQGEGVLEVSKRDVTPLIEFLSRARSHLRNNKFAEAEQEYDQVLAIDPGNILAHRTLGFLYLDHIPRLDKAIKHNLAVLDQIQDDFICLFNLGVAYSKSDKPDETEKVYLKCREIIEKEPNPNMLTKGKLYLFLGDAQARQSKKDQAKANLIIAKQILEELRADKARDIWLERTKQILARVDSQCETVR